jgi:hypothetical protein
VSPTVEEDGYKLRNFSGEITMDKKRIFVVVAVMSLLFAGAQSICSQSNDADRSGFEVGGQFSALRNVVIRDVGFTFVQCINPPCPTILTISRSREIQPGFGGRLAYNLNGNFALEGELNFFPGTGSFSQPEAFKGGNTIEGLFGLKAGKRFPKIGIFGKARPGFLYATKGDLQTIPNTGCIAIFPAPAGCFETRSKNSFAFDLGGVVEFYPTKRTIIRFDVGDTIVGLAERNVSGVLNPTAGRPPLFVVLRIPGETTHNLQISAGVGFRF